MNPNLNSEYIISQLDRVQNKIKSIDSYVSDPYNRLGSNSQINECKSITLEAREIIEDVKSMLNRR